VQRPKPDLNPTFTDVKLNMNLTF